jgi:Putative transposase
LPQGRGASRDARLGRISFLHRFGSALNTHFHYHRVVLDGASSQGPDGEVGFHEADAPDSDSQSPPPLPPAEGPVLWESDADGVREGVAGDHNEWQLRLFVELDARAGNKTSEFNPQSRTNAGLWRAGCSDCKDI